MQWTQNLCRICGQISETCLSIFSDGVRNALEEKIKKCLNLTLSQGDYKPKQICNSCIMKLNEFSEFMDICYATNQKFESIHFSSQTWQNRSFSFPQQKQTVIVSNKQAPDNLDLQLYKNTGIVLDKAHMNSCQLNESDVLDPVGDSSYNSENYDNNTRARSAYSTVLRHPSNTESFNFSNYVRRGTDQCNSNKICYINSSFNPNSSAAFKDCEEGGDNLKKRTISLKAVQSSLIRSSNTSFEKGKKSHLCPHCLKRFSRRGTLTSHVASHTNIRPYKCEECSKSFAIKSELTTHKKIHGDTNKCKYCTKKFSVPSKLKRHLRIHTNDKPFVCNFANCGKAFSDKRNLVGHKLTHMPEKTYSCPVCFKLFKSLNKLKQHSKCHNCGIMYTCDLCSKKYKYKSNLISHIKKHCNVCPYCKLNCESKSILYNHLKLCKGRL